MALALILSVGQVLPACAASATVMATTQRMSDATLASTQAGWYSRGQVLNLVCHKRGQAVQGYYSPYLPNGGWDDLWHQVDDGYFVADVDISTGSNDPVAPLCGSTGGGGFALPFAAGVAMKVTQSPGGGHSHNDDYNRTAVDWGTPSGTAIVASGAGTVYFEGWTTGSYAGAGIMILLDHGNDDCTQYAHLSSTVINRGDRVERGQLIAYSGATGGVTGPHLHWAGVSCSTQRANTVSVCAAGARVYGVPATWLSSTSAVSGVFSGSAGVSYQVRVQARDAAGAVSPWSGWVTFAMPYDDRSASVSGSWSAGTSTSDYLGTYRFTRSAGASVSLTGYTDQVTVVGRKNPSYGKAKVYVDGVYKVTIDAYASTTSYR